MDWQGNAQLKRYLAPVDELHAHPRNARRGNVYEIGRSLDRFGQQRPILALPDGTIVAGHHVWTAAKQRDWTHVAVIRSELTEAEVDAYLLADNGTADAGQYDERVLAELLSEWEDYEGTGFGQDEAKALVASMLWMPDAPERAPAAANPREQPLGEGTATAFNIVLTFDEATFGRVTVALDGLMEKHGVDTYAAAIAAEALA
jgi:ParB-like chromosome segregation protein Spo0J